MDNNIKKCLKSYLIGNEHLNNDKMKAYKYFNKSLKYLNNIKTKNISINNYEDILTETEIECNKNIVQLNNDISDNYISDNYISDINDLFDFSKINLEINEKILYYDSLTNNTNDISYNNINLFDIILKGEIINLNNNSNLNYNFYIFDEEGDTPAHKTIKFGDTRLLKQFLLLGLPIDIVNKEGHTLLEIASLAKDNNMINFLLRNGANIDKHLFFRENEYNVISNYNYIDYSILLKIISQNKNVIDNNNYIIDLNFLFQYFNKSDLIGYNKMTYYDLILCLEILLNTFALEYKQTYINIIREELEFNLNESIYCPKNSIEILLTYLIPFIDYKFIITIDWYINYELKYIMLNILKNNNNIKKNIKKSFNLYLKCYIENIFSHWVSKIKI